MSFIYAIKCEGYVKVGVARDVASRMGGLQVGCPFPLTLGASWALPASKVYECEAAAHQLLADFRHAGEWFACTVDQAAEGVDLAVAPAGGCRVGTPAADAMIAADKAATKDAGERRRNGRPWPLIHDRVVKTVTQVDERPRPKPAKPAFKAWAPVKLSSCAD